MLRAFIAHVVVYSRGKKVNDDKKTHGTIPTDRTDHFRIPSQVKMSELSQVAVYPDSSDIFKVSGIV